MGRSGGRGEKMSGGDGGDGKGKKEKGREVKDK